MHTKTYRSLIPAILLAFIFSLLTTGCGGKDDAIEYRNDDVGYVTGEECVERYLFYEEDGEYERYVGRTYFGHELGSSITVFGTLFETGTYTVDESKTSDNITFTPKKRYDFDTEQLATVGITDREETIDETSIKRLLVGTITDDTLTITWTWNESYYPYFWNVKEKTADIAYDRQ